MYFVYILTNSDKNVLYTGITNNLEKRVMQHYLDRGNKKTFTGRYACFNLLYFETYEDVLAAIAREKEIKGWIRKKKETLIRVQNPEFKFINDTIFDVWPPDNLL
jgi:putative endonuclease